jgi:glutathione S-transferase
MQAITVHHLEYSRSSRILWMLEELDLDYELRTYKRDRHFRAPPELAEVHPLGRAPLVTVGDQVLAESGAIIEYFADHHPQLRPAESLQDYRFWLHYAEGSVMPPLLVRLVIDNVRNAKLPFFIKPVARGIADKVDARYTDDALALHLGFMNDALQSREWFAGDAFTGADVQMLYAVLAGLGRGRVDELGNLEAWVKRVEARPAYQRAVEKGGPALP